LPELSAAEVPDYLPRLRRNLPAYCFRVPETAAIARAEHFLFWSNYKGSTDFFTRYVYPPLVWRSVRPLARWRVHPNWISGLNVVITLGAVPLFAAGLFGPGLLLAWTMSVLDSVDGKLARLTYRASKLGHVLDHGLDVIHPPLWYLAWAWPLGGGDPASFVFQSALWMTGLYVADRLVTEAFTRITGGRSIHAYSELDVRARTFISRRNINLPIFTLGWLVGAAVPAFLLIVAWQAATLVFHAVRLVQVGLSERRDPGAARAAERSP
jgi:phosphatidylglycerophosphate synthase